MMDREMEDLDIDDHQDFGPIHGRNNYSKYEHKHRANLIDISHPSCKIGHMFFGYY
jgi:hypothetical protein